MSDEQTYNDALLSALQCLDDAEGHVNSAILNIAFAGPHQKLGKLYEIGETFVMQSSMFADTGDNNINIILPLIEAIQNAKKHIMNLNGLGD